jgi:hypothetical protein
VLDHADARHEAVVFRGKLADRFRQPLGFGLLVERPVVGLHRACPGCCFAATLELPLIVATATAARCEPTVPRLEMRAIRSAAAAVAPHIINRHRPCTVTGALPSGASVPEALGAGHFRSAFASRTSSAIC